MRLILRVIEGPAAGARLTLASGQAAQIGRSQWVDFPLPDDPRLADVHFLVQAAPAGCRIKALSESDLRVNGSPVSETALQHGDRIAAGGSVFETQVQGARPPETRPSPAGAAPKAARREGAETASAIAGRVLLSDDARRILNDEQTPTEFLGTLVDAELYGDAARFHAAELSPQEAVRWASACVRQACGDRASSEELAALETAERWADDPTEENRRAAESAAEALGRNGPAAFVALAAFWSGDNIAPPNLPEAPMPPGLTAEGVAAALLLAAPQAGAGKIPETLRAFLAQAPAAEDALVGEN